MVTVLLYQQIALRPFWTRVLCLNIIARGLFIRVSFVSFFCGLQQNAVIIVLVVSKLLWKIGHNFRIL